MPVLISVTGQSGSGKTTLIEKLIPEFKKRGYRVGTVKHTHHGVDDQSGKDSWRHKEAGADTVIVAAPDGLAVMKTSGCDSLDKLVPFLEDVDLVITEGYKSGNKPKIEVVRAARLVAGVVTQLEERLDVGVPGLEVDARGAFALSALVHGRDR